MSDKIIIQDLELSSCIGCSEAERQSAQKLLLCIEIHLPLNRAAQSARLEDSLCYTAVAQHCQRLAAEKPWILLEELTQAVGQSVLQMNIHIEFVKVRIKKFVLPSASWVAVEMTRGPDDYHQRSSGFEV